jgi:hypothetical protein
MIVKKKLKFLNKIILIIIILFLITAIGNYPKLNLVLNEI